MTSLTEYSLPDQCRAVAMLADNAADQLRRFANDPLNADQLKTTRNACTLGVEVLQGILERLPTKPKRASKLKEG